MRVLVVCVSTEHGNTRKIAEGIAAELSAELLGPDQVDTGTLADYDLVGFGSGIRFARHYRALLDLVERLPQSTGQSAFIFSTSGFGWASQHRALRRRLRAKGWAIRGELCCKGLDTIAPLGWFGGVNKGRPNEQDLDEARAFAGRLSERPDSR